MPSPTPNDSHRHAAPTTPPTQPTHWLDTFFKYTAAIAVDHTHMLPLDRVSGSTGHVTSSTRNGTCGCG